MVRELVIWTALVPLTVSVAVLGASRLLPRATWRRAWPGALVVGLAYGLGNWGLSSGLQGSSPETRLMIVALIGTALGVLESLWGRSSAAGWSVRAAASSLAAWLVISPLVEPAGWSVWQSAGLVLLLGGAGLLCWAVLDRLATAERGPLPALIAAALGGAGAGVVLLSGLASLGQLSGTLAVPLVAFGLASWLRPGGAALRGAAPALALLLVAHWTTALLYGEMKPVTFGLLTAAPLVLLVPRLSRHELLVAAVRLLLMMVPLGGALATSATQYFGDASAPAASSSPSASGEDEDDDDYGYDP